MQQIIDLDESEVKGRGPEAFDLRPVTRDLNTISFCPATVYHEMIWCCKTATGSGNRKGSRERGKEPKRVNG
jgi:hypothetical protein